MPHCHSPWTVRRTSKINIQNIMPQTLRAIVGSTSELSPSQIPALLVAVAVGGSCLYGGSLALVSPGWSAGNAAMWLALSAGLAWCVFIPFLWKATRLPLTTCFHACLIAMAGGEVVLTSGALVNVLLAARHVTEHAAGINLAIVGISNVVMLAILGIILLGHGIPFRRTAAWWMVVLNGSGAVLFAAFFRPLHTA
jgi:hypothetical protein